MQKWEYLCIEVIGTNAEAINGAQVRAAAERGRNLAQAVEDLKGLGRTVSGTPKGPFIWDYISRLGDEGWELAGTLSNDIGQVSGILILKRPKP